MSKVYSIDEIKTIVSDVAKQYGVKKAALFGSYCRGNPNEQSDIDLLIDKGNIRGLIMFNSFVNLLQERLDKPVDVMTYSSLNKSLIKDSVDNEVVLYEQP
ncbi:MAG: nucleotidyltransferase family protein [Clostridia bacterium]